MDEELEGLWIDREQHRHELTFFDQVVDLTRAAQDLAFDQPALQHEDDERDVRVRVVVEGPSDRMIANTWYLPGDSSLQLVGDSKRLVVGSLFDASEQVSLAARRMAADFFRDGLEALYGDRDGRFGVMTGNAAELAGDRIDAEAWLRRARRAVGIEDDN